MMTDQQPDQPGQPYQPYPGAQPVYPAPPPQPGQAQPGYPPQPGYQGYPAPAYGVPMTPAYPAVPRGGASPDDLTLPLYGATFGQAISRFFKKYATFSGRASRSEYWWVQLFIALMWTAIFLFFGVVGGIVGAQASGTGDADGWTAGIGALFGIVFLVVGLGMVIPSIAIAWRRLHDANFAGPFWFLALTSVGAIVVLVFTILPSNPQGQRFDRV